NIDRDQAKKFIEKKLKKELNHFRMAVLVAYITKINETSELHNNILLDLVEFAIKIKKYNPEDINIGKKLKKDINKAIKEFRKSFKPKKYDQYYNKIRKFLLEIYWLGEEMYVKYAILFINDIFELFCRKEKNFFDAYMKRMLNDFRFDETIVIFLNIVLTLNNNDIETARTLKRRLGQPLDVFGDKMIEFKLRNH
ncbi:MAG: hypothetical protein GY699_03395, partial [Desulfobacteraceae bacterium]|nr:hypothetical protein [Desulfobacteraceae bacterium]